jgi:DNA mismatch repair protein MutS
MVEMIEASRILRCATEKSLVILDEIGRGTSTYDGVSIAWAICEYIHDHMKAKTLFATHYHELIGLVSGMKRARNLSVAVSEKAGASGHSELVFLYKIIEGGTSRSYGIEVARLAGLPKEIVMRARGVLEKLENKTIDTGRVVNEDQIEMFDNREHKTLSELKDLDPNNMTPLDALKKLHELKEKGII